MTRIAVAARSFARNPVLRIELAEKYPDVTFSESARLLEGAALLKLLRGHDRAIIGLECIDDSVLAELPELKSSANTASASTASTCRRSSGTA